MTLAIDIGILAWTLDEDPEAAGWFEEDLAVVNRVLAAQRIRPHEEPRELPDEAWDSRAASDGIGYVALALLRRAFAHRALDPAWVAKPLPDGEDPAADPVLEGATESFESHLLSHDDAEGWYVPVDFPLVVTSDEDDDLPGGLLGSSQRLLAELRLVAPALGITLEGGDPTDAEAARVNAIAAARGPLWAEHEAWIALFEAARLSIRYKTAIVFG